jgi:hypothetical protein
MSLNDSVHVICFETFKIYLLRCARPQLSAGRNIEQDSSFGLHNITRVSLLWKPVEIGLLTER